MTINVSNALDLNTSIRITIDRTVGAYVDGKWDAGKVSIIKLLASPQQPTATQLLTLSEGERTKNVMRFICNKRIRTTNEATGTPADVINFDGLKFKVIEVANWSTFGYSDVMAVEQ